MKQTWNPERSFFESGITNPNITSFQKGQNIFEKLKQTWNPARSSFEPNPDIDSLQTGQNNFL